jgi:hypothetical protein
MKAAAKKLTTNMCVVASGLAAGGTVRALLSFYDSGMQGRVADTMGVLACLSVVVSAWARSFWARVLGAAKE